MSSSIQFAAVGSLAENSLYHIAEAEASDSDSDEEEKAAVGDEDDDGFERIKSRQEKKKDKVGPLLPLFKVDGLTIVGSMTCYAERNSDRAPEVSGAFPNHAWILA